MSNERLQKKFETILRNVASCPSAEVCIISNHEAGRNQPGYFIGISADNSIEIDKIQAVMAMTGAKFEKWQKDHSGELMIYFVPAPRTV